MKKTWLILTAALAIPLCGYSQSLILNGSFETCQPGYDPADPGGWGVMVTYPGLPSGTGSVDNWNISHGTGWDQFYWYWTTSGGLTAQDGSRFMNLTAGSGQTTFESLSQSFSVTAGLTYQVSYYERERSAGANLSSLISLGAGSATGSLSQIANAGSTWTQFSYSFTPDTSTTATLSFAQAAWAPGLDNGVLLDNIIVTVPEPSTLALVGLGALALAGYRRRNK